MKILYVGSPQLFTEGASGIHVARMCEALSDLGHDTTLLLPIEKEEIGDFFSFYGVKNNFLIKPAAGIKKSSMRHFFHGIISFIKFQLFKDYELVIKDSDGVYEDAIFSVKVNSDNLGKTLNTEIYKKTKAIFEIQDEDGNGLNGVLIQINGDNIEKKTNSNGNVSVDLPFTKDELEINPFLRANTTEIKTALNMRNDTSESVFAELRRRRDSF